ncbi:MAG: hypothetical protein A2X67_06375 [Ignavibacteria bacterium GWA2_55_11]|nr:MAG: hypothetical protein A2X67_06375 [Ignavibacteria bacterium GWA2_55_11]
MEYLYILPVLLFSVIVHEISHGWLALRLGDPTARDAGRLTFNPISHLDLFGSIILPAILVFTGSSFFLAWAKPVPVNPANLRNPRRDDVLVSAVGPFSNLVVGLGCAIMFVLSIHILGAPDPQNISVGRYAADTVLNMFYIGIPVNIALALFNLLPIPPLDGSHILASILPGRLSMMYRQVGFAGILILVVVMRLEPVRIAFGAAQSALMIPYNFLIQILT